MARSEMSVNSSLSLNSDDVDNYRFLVDNSLFGIVIVQDEAIVYANNRASELMSSTTSGLLGSSVYKNIHPSHKKRVQRYHILRDQGRKVPQKYDVPLLLPSGAIRYLEFQSQKIFFNSKPALLIDLSDVSSRVSYANALKSSEERYKILVESNPDLVLVLDDVVIKKANAAAMKVLGYRPEELSGLTPWEISPEIQPGNAKSEDLCRSLIAKAKQGGAISFEWVHTKKDGETVDCEVYLVWCPIGDNPYLQVIVRDITERKKAEEQRRELESQMEAQKKQFYRNTILSFTEGKLEVVEQEELAPIIGDARLSVPVEKSSDLSHIRKLLANYFAEFGIDEDVLATYLIGVGEALTNAIAHAESGTLYAGTMQDYIWAAVWDEGSGIEPLLIPQATIAKGFSTKPSMGYGFTLILGVADKTLLCTDRTGTAIVLLKKYQNFNPNDNNLSEFSDISLLNY